MALGASSHTVRRLVFGEGLRLAAVGAAIGAAGSLAGNRLMQSLLFETAALNPAMVVAAVLLPADSLLRGVLCPRAARRSHRSGVAAAR